MIIKMIDGRLWRDGRPLCTQCNKNLAQKNYKVSGKFQDKCSTCSRGYSSRTNATVKQLKMSGCEQCGFIPAHTCQMDIDHINGDHTDNRPENRRVLCANCHRLKTWQSREGNQYQRELDRVHADAVEKYLQV